MKRSCGVSTCFRSVVFFVLSIGCQQSLADDLTITPDKLGLPVGNERTSEPSAIRIYKTDDDGEPLKKQPAHYPFTIKADYKLKDNETPIRHYGVDLSSRSAQGQPSTPLEFKAGVYGIVTKAGGGDWGTISIRLADGSYIQFLHTSASYVKVGDLVAPDSKLGLTGKKGADEVHLHVQAFGKDWLPISPDGAFRAGQDRLASRAKVQPGPALDPYRPLITSRPKIVDGVVQVDGESTLWIVEIIGGSGQVQGVLGQFPTYSEAIKCSVAWSKANPDDLRLTREREVTLKNP
jgi:peptidase M23-like protein